jgi:hypothetical protein
VAPSGVFAYLEEASLGHHVWDTYYRLPAGKPLCDWLFAQTAPSLLRARTFGAIGAGPARDHLVHPLQ